MFDPYRKWLGILPKDQPPNHYRLLSLELFEHDLDIIESAVDRTMSFIRQYQSGEHATEAANLLNELARARICLLKPATKSEYDAKLKFEMSRVQNPKAELAAPEMDWDSVELPAAPRKPVALRRKKSKKSRLPPWPWILAGVTGGLVLLVILTLSKPGDTRSSEVAVSVPVVTETPHSVASVPATEKPLATTAVPETTKTNPIPADTPAPTDLASSSAAIPASEPTPQPDPDPDPEPTPPSKPAPAPQSARITNLVPHGNMEIPAKKFSKTFTVVTPNGEKITVDRSEQNPHSGQACMHIAGTCPWVGVKILKMNIPKGKTIHGKAWRRADLGGGHFLLTTVKNERVVQKHELWGENSKDWQEIFWTLTPEQLENATQLIVELAAGKEFDVYFDDICIWVE